MADSFSNSQIPTNFRCPNCRSQFVQTLPTAYAYTARLFRDGVNPDAMPGAMEPPQRRSEVIFPAIAGTVVFSLIYIASVLVAFETGLFRHDLDGIHDARVITPAAIAGFATAVRFIWRAARFNRHEYRALLEEWRSTAICRRCSTQFRPSELRWNGGGRK